ncbi:probable inactive tRNA-specific adenosine deaminase-like protein 3 [Haliotis rubra]|uniref:probable inactive tRNA-specific adenosine deaminase-like protein 3 n=1 Tax=Haliotis rubra TaxID=36100 RepID=UPI001EE6305A|nr:probable inactive tRNA-specific adenosine deaminase-like protein 3 [Haliotis rubra]XP_046564120.1 probable inactive tRNA-specific adenosine deaminase-like protein 3 [Haliotis rubra]
METDTKRTKTGPDSDLMGQPEAVLEDRYTDPISLVDAYACIIQEKKQTAKIVKELTCDLPLTDLLHLKRVRNHKTKDNADQLQVIVCPKSATDSKSDVDILDSIASRFPALGKPVLVKVPQNPPLTRTQYQDAIKYWPVSFHENKRVMSLLSGHFFSSSEVRTIHAHMNTVLHQAKVAGDKGQVAIGAVVVDPSTDTVLALAHDLRQGHNPLQHAVMVAVDLVAYGQGGGMWDIQDSDMKYHSTADTVTQPSRDGCTKVGPYLCTGYDLYVNSEPCIMCAMSLVHSRIGRVFYSSPHPEGALGTRYKLHVQPGLNHHYQVFRGALPTQCLNLDQHG